MFLINTLFIAYLYRPRNCRSDGDRRPTPSYRSLGYRGWVSVFFAVNMQHHIDSRFFFPQRRRRLTPCRGLRPC